MNNKELDAVGAKLFGVAKLSGSEIDRIASAPELFDGVRSRIANGRRADKPAGFFFRNRILLGSAGAAICIAAFLTLLLQQDSGGAVLETGLNTPVERSGAARSELTPQVRFVKGFTQGRAEVPSENPETPKVQYAIRNEYRRPGPRVERASFTEPKAENEFVAVTYTGDGGESARGGRVIRVDVPSSTLFAMGFDVSLENASPTVKADLLIGPDGVTRAIRLVE